MSFEGSPYMCFFVGVQSFELPYFVISGYIILIYPLVVGVWIPLPFDQILQTPSSAELPRVQNGLDFVFFLVIHKIRWRALVICAMCYCFTVWREKIYVKHRVDAPLRG